MIGNEKTQFKKGNRDAEKWSLEKAEELFNKAYEYALINKDCLCVEDAIYHSGIPFSTFYNLSKKSTVLEDIKKDINRAILRRINKKGLNGEFNATMSIWRLKQLGEEDVTKTDVTTKGKEINNTPIINFVKSDDEQ